jgi:hypothetical protein
MVEEIEKIITTNKKNIRKLEYIWNILINPKNYIIPETIEEYKSYFYTPKITINNQECYFNKVAEDNLNEFVNIFQEIKEIEKFVSLNYIRSTVIKFIAGMVKNRIEKKDTPNTSQIANIVSNLIDSQRSYQFIRVIEGLEFKNLKSIKLGEDEIFIFDSDYKENLRHHCEKVGSLEYYQKSAIPMIDKYFLNKICLKVKTFGELEKAGDIALKRMKLIVNMLRFYLCLFINKRVHQRMILISLSNEVFKSGDEAICIGCDSDEITLFYGRGRMSLQKFEITSELIDKLKKDCFFDETVSLIAKDNLSELEGSILAAIYWTGEAQHEFDYDVAFLKYWTALETVTFNPTDISEALSANTAILLAFGGYDFIKIEDIEDTKRLLKRLYNKRSDIIHEGMREKISPLDLIDICKYSTWTVLCLLNLRRLNYKNLEDIKKETERLYSVNSKSA